jgi:hypothetical protein
LGDPVVVRAMGAANEPCHGGEGVIVSSVLRIRDIGNESGRLNVNSQEAADVAHPT